jgi:hypothetical protein
MTVIELTDEEAAVLKAKVATAGLTLEAWLQTLAAPDAPVEKPMQAVADIILSSMRDIPSEVAASMPTDGASQHDHYIYGWPKKEA